MITKFKMFESINNNEPMEGDFVICDSELYNRISSDVATYFANNIGEIISIISNNGKKSYRIEYKNFPFSRLLPGLKVFNYSDIKYWSNNHKELDDILKIKAKATKYNIL